MTTTMDLTQATSLALGLGTTPDCREFTYRDLLAMQIYSLNRDIFVDMPFEYTIEKYLESEDRYYEQCNAYTGKLSVYSFADMLICDAAESIMFFGDSYGKLEKAILEEYNKIHCTA